MKYFMHLLSHLYSKDVFIGTPLLADHEINFKKRDRRREKGREGGRNEEKKERHGGRGSIKEFLRGHFFLKLSTLGHQHP